VPELAELACGKCHWTNACGPTAMLAWLRTVKMARRDTEPDLDVIGELFRAAAGRFQCPRCGSVGLAVRPCDEENDEDWGMARKCEACGRPIDAQRLQVFPQTRRCVDCQARAEGGQDDGPAEYCPRCGNVMQLRPSARGVTRYTLVCPQCRR